MSKPPHLSGSRLLMLAILVTAGCSNVDPMDRPGTWRAVGTNERNLQAMIANPADLEVGVAAVTERGDVGANAVTRLLLERRRPLPAVRASDLGSIAQQPADPPLPGLGGRAAGGGAAR